VAVPVIVVVAVVTVVVAIVVIIAVTVAVTVVSQVAVIIAKTINLSRFLISPMLFCTRKQVAVANAYTTGQKVMGWGN
jgi:hypothetical protein